MSARNKRIGHPKERRGYTLVELLTVMIIIALLATLGLAVQRASVESARRDRTRTTIAKIDHILAGIYEKYQYRTVPLPNYDDVQLSNILTGYSNGGGGFISSMSDGERGKARRTARMVARTMALRELLQMDMPTSVGEIMDAAGNQLLPEFNEATTPLANFYYNTICRFEDPINTTNAELLYLIVMNADPEARTMFHEREIGVWDDGDRVGGNVFLDGWGNPICFLRWAPGLVDSDRQPSIEDGLLIQAYQMAKRYESGLAQLSADDLNVIDTALGCDSGTRADRLVELEQDTLFRDLQEQYSDPLDPMGVCDGWYLTPLVYSCGPDGEPGMKKPTDASFETSRCRDPFQGDFLLLGLPDYAAKDSTSTISSTSTVVRPISEEDDGEGGGGTGEPTEYTEYAKDNITNHSMAQN